MNTQTIDPANLKPGEQAPIPTTLGSLVIEALRSANRVGGLLNEIAAWAHSQRDGQPGGRLYAEFEKLEDLLVRRFSDCSGVHLFIAANNLGVDLPPDIDGSSDDAEYDD